MHKYFMLFVYISLIFLAIFLFNYGYVKVEIDRLDYKYLALSFFFLFMGFLGNAFCWYLICRQSTKKISFLEAVASHGLSIFGKYIPGKVWTILGRATCLSRIGISLTTTTQLSIYTYLLSVWSGFGLGIVASIFISFLKKYLWVLVILWVLFCIVLFSPIYKIQFINNVIKKIGRDNLPLRQLNFTTAVNKLPAFFLFWLCWSLAFLFLLKSLFPTTEFEFHSALAFPFATTIGIVAFIFPGGLGVRESCLVFYLVNTGMLMENAALASIVARIWFTIGEIFTFILAAVLKVKFLEKKKINSSPI